MGLREMYTISKTPNPGNPESPKWKLRFLYKPERSKTPKVREIHHHPYIEGLLEVVVALFAVVEASAGLLQAVHGARRGKKGKEGLMSRKKGKRIAVKAAALHEQHLQAYRRKAVETTPHTQPARVKQTKNQSINQSIR